MEKETSLTLHIEDVYKSYGEKLVLNDVDLKVRAGEFCTVVGPSGCGKSTLLRLVLGQEAASSGTILLDGAPIGFPNRDRGIVYQRYSLYPHLSVLDNVLIGKRLERSYFAWRRERVAIRDEALEFLKKVRLSGHENKYPHELSGGMQQRVAIAQALIMRPKILLMDEPFGALDPLTREDVQLFLLELWQEMQMTIFFVTHDLEEAMFMGTRLFVLSQFYSDGSGADVRGAKIVADHALPRRITSTFAKDDPEFLALREQIRQEGFEPEYLQHVKDFNLKHPDSFST